MAEIFNSDLSDLIEFSRRYGSNPRYVLAGGGNTSKKVDGVLFVKGSGKALADVNSDTFVAMERALLDGVFLKEYPQDDTKREAAVLADVMAARAPGSQDKRPSVEAPLHNLLKHKYVLHVHPALVNGLTCSADGEQIAKGLIDEDILWVPICRPGYTLCKLCIDKIEDYRAAAGKYPSVMLLQNHGIFIGADDVEELDRLTAQVMDALGALVEKEPDLSAAPYDESLAQQVISEVRSAYPNDVFIELVTNAQVLEFVKDAEAFKALDGALTPDHIVYCKAEFLYVDSLDAVGGLIRAYNEKYGYMPRVVCVAGLGAVIVGETQKECENAAKLFLDAVKVAAYAQNFGGVRHMTNELVDFIKNWEVESYRQSVK